MSVTVRGSDGWLVGRSVTISQNSGHSNKCFFVVIRQENEEIYTPLHLVPPTVPGLARAIETKYNVSATAIR